MAYGSGRPIRVLEKEGKGRRGESFGSKKSYMAPVYGLPVAYGIGRLKSTWRRAFCEAEEGRVLEKTGWAWE